MTGPGTFSWPRCARKERCACGMVGVIGIGRCQKYSGVDNDHGLAPSGYSGLRRVLGGQVLGKDLTVPPAEVAPARAS
jgi:hypothetical protein